jgi:hypothetical protein
MPDARLRLGPEFLVLHRVRFYERADSGIVSSIDLGILFLMAFWSGPSRSAFAKLKDALKREDPEGRIELAVVDADGSPDLERAPLFLSSISGAGETAWI